MKTLVEKLNLTELTIAYGMSVFFSLPFLSHQLIWIPPSRNKVSSLYPLSKQYSLVRLPSPVSFQTTPADPLIKRVETVGKIHPHVKAKIISTDRYVSLFLLPSPHQYYLLC